MNLYIFIIFFNLTIIYLISIKWTLNKLLWSYQSSQLFQSSSIKLELKLKSQLSNNGKPPTAFNSNQLSKTPIEKKSSLKISLKSPSTTNKIQNPMKWVLTNSQLLLKKNSNNNSSDSLPLKTFKSLKKSPHQLSVMLIGLLKEPSLELKIKVHVDHVGLSQPLVLLKV